MTGVAAWLGLATSLASAATPPGLPLPAGTVVMREGEVRINLTPAWYGALAGTTGAAGIMRTLRASGWRPVIGPAWPALHDGAGIAAWEHDGHLVLIGAFADAASPVLVAWFVSGPAWTGRGGEAPGRDPAGLPRLGGGRRQLHVEGDGFEAACYRSGRTPRAILGEAEARLRAIGWSVVAAGDGALDVSRTGAPPIAIIVRSDGTGAQFLVLAGRKPA